VYQEAGVIQLPSQFNTLVQGLNIEDITPQQILAAGEPIFLDIRTSSDINSINTLIQSWSRIHAPTFGQPIPGSGKLFSRINTGSIIAASGNEVRLVLSVNFTNLDPINPTTLQLELDNSIVLANTAVGPLETLVATLPSHLYIDATLGNLKVTILTGDGALLTTEALSMLVVQ
jgi:hypothetical protein